MLKEGVEYDENVCQLSTKSTCIRKMRLILERKKVCASSIQLTRASLGKAEKKQRT